MHIFKDGPVNQEVRLSAPVSRGFECFYSLESLSLIHCVKSPWSRLNTSSRGGETDTCNASKPGTDPLEFARVQRGVRKPANSHKVYGRTPLLRNL